MVTNVIGSWTLTSFEIESPTGQRKPWGKNAHGLLIYSDTGHMSVSINRDLVNNSPEEHKNIFDSILFYSGTFSVSDSVITHKVTEASNPTRIGKNLIRHTKLDNDLLTLSSPQESFGTAHLIWKRISK